MRIAQKAFPGFLEAGPALDKTSREIARMFGAVTSAPSKGAVRDCIGDLSSLNYRAPDNLEVCDIATFRDSATVFILFRHTGDERERKEGGGSSLARQLSMNAVGIALRLQSQTHNLPDRNPATHRVEKTRYEDGLYTCVVLTDQDHEWTRSVAIYEGARSCFWANW